MKRRRASSLQRISAWMTIQALVFFQIFSTFIWADPESSALRQRGAGDPRVKSGLEEKLLDSSYSLLKEEALLLWEQVQAIQRADPTRPLLILANKTDGALVVQVIRPWLEGLPGVKVISPYIRSSYYHEDTARIDPQDLDESVWAELVRAPQPHLLFVDGKKDKSNHKHAPDSFWFVQNLVDLFSIWLDPAGRTFPVRHRWGDFDGTRMTSREKTWPIRLDHYRNKVDTIFSQFNRANPNRKGLRPYRLVATEEGLQRRNPTRLDLYYEFEEAGWEALRFEHLGNVPHAILHRTPVFFEREDPNWAGSDAREIPDDLIPRLQADIAKVISQGTRDTTGLEEAKFKELPYYKPKRVNEEEDKKLLFGTDGVPGVYTEEPIIEKDYLSPAVSYRMALGAGFLALSHGKPRAMVTGDSRENSEPLMKAALDGLDQLGIQVTLVGQDAATGRSGIAPSPIALQAIAQADVGAGVVITGSHLLADRNRIKIILPDGHKVDDAWKRRIERLINATDLKKALESLAKEIGVPPPRFAQLQQKREVLPSGDQRPVDAYIRQVVKAAQRIFTALGVTREGEIPLSFDLANGAAVYVLPQVLKELPFLKPEYLYDDGSGRTINEGCGADFLDKQRRLPSRVRPEQLKGRLLDAADGDADRYCGATVDDQGNVIFIDGDRTMALYATLFQRLLKVLRLPLRIGVVQTPYGDNSARTYLEEKLGVFVSPYVRTGEQYVLQEIEGRLKGDEIDIGIGFEPNGHGFVIFHEKRAIEAIRKASPQKGEGKQAKEILLGIIDLFQGAVGGDTLRHALAVHAIYEYLHQKDPQRVKSPADLDNPEVLYRALYIKHTVAKVSKWDLVETKDELRMKVTYPEGLDLEIEEILDRYRAQGVFRKVVGPSGTESGLRVCVIGTGRDKEEKEAVDKALQEIVDLLVQHPQLNPLPEEGGFRLSREEIRKRLKPLRERLKRNPVKVLAVDVDGILAPPGKPVSETTIEPLRRFRDISDEHRVAVLTGIFPGEYQERVGKGLGTERVIPLVLSGAYFLPRSIPEVAVGILKGFIQENGFVLRSNNGFIEVRDPPQDPTGRLVGIVIRFDKSWLKGLDSDPREEWVEELKQLLVKGFQQAGISKQVVEEIVRDLRPSGEASIDCLPLKPKTFMTWVSQANDYSPRETAFVDDSIQNLRFPEGWEGLLLSLDRYHPEFDPASPSYNPHFAPVFQIARPGEQKPANFEEVTQLIVEMLIETSGDQTGLEEEWRKPAIEVSEPDAQGRRRIPWDQIPEGPGKEVLKRIEERAFGKAFVIGSWVRNLLLERTDRSRDMDLVFDRTTSPHDAVSLLFDQEFPPVRSKDIPEPFSYESDRFFFQGLPIDILDYTMGPDKKFQPDEMADLSVNRFVLGFDSAYPEEIVLWDPYGAWKDLFPRTGPRQARLVKPEGNVLQGVPLLVLLSELPSKLKRLEDLHLGPLSSDDLDYLQTALRRSRQEGNLNRPPSATAVVTVKQILDRFDAWLAKQAAPSPTSGLEEKGPQPIITDRKRRDALGIFNGLRESHRATPSSNSPGGFIESFDDEKTTAGDLRRFQKFLRQVAKEGFVHEDRINEQLQRLRLSQGRLNLNIDFGQFGSRKWLEALESLRRRIRVPPASGGKSRFHDPFGDGTAADTLGGFQQLIRIYYNEADGVKRDELRGYLVSHGLNIEQDASGKFIQDWREFSTRPLTATGLEEAQDIEEVALKFFGADLEGKSERQQREAEIALEGFLVRGGEDAIRKFVQLIEADRGESIGPWWIPPVDLDEPEVRKRLPKPGSLYSVSPEKDREGKLIAYSMPRTWEEIRAMFEEERLRRMAQVAIQRALGRKVVVTVGIGIVGTAEMLVGSSSQGEMPVRQYPKLLRFRGPLSGKDQYPVFSLGYQRLSAGTFRQKMLDRGLVGIRADDPTVEPTALASHKRGNMVASFLQEVLAVADYALVSVEQHPYKTLPGHPESIFADPGPGLQIVREATRLLPEDSCGIIESTVFPYYMELFVIPTAEEELKDRNIPKEKQPVWVYSFQRLLPGRRLLQSNREQVRVGGATTDKGLAKLEEYYKLTNYRRYTLTKRIVIAEATKDSENAIRYQVIAATAPLQEIFEKLGLDIYEASQQIVGEMVREEILDPDRRQVLIDSIQALESVYEKAQEYAEEHIADPEERNDFLRSVLSMMSQSTTAILNQAILYPGGYCVIEQLGHLIYGMIATDAAQELDAKVIFWPALTTIAYMRLRQQYVAAWIVSELVKRGIDPRDASVWAGGVTYARKIEDARNGVFELLMRYLADMGVTDFTVFEPYASRWDQVQRQDAFSPESEGYGLTGQTWLRGVHFVHDLDPHESLHPEHDVVILAMDHPQLVGAHQPKARRTDGKGVVHSGIDAVKVTARVGGGEGKILLDTHRFLDTQDIREFLALGWEVRVLGRGDVDAIKKEVEGNAAYQEMARARLRKELRRPPQPSRKPMAKADPQVILNHVVRTQVEPAVDKLQVNVEETAFLAGALVSQLERNRGVRPNTPQGLLRHLQRLSYLCSLTRNLLADTELASDELFTEEARKLQAIEGQEAPASLEPSQAQGDLVKAMLLQYRGVNASFQHASEAIGTHMGNRDQEGSIAHRILEDRPTTHSPLAEQGGLTPEPELLEASERLLQRFRQQARGSGNFSPLETRATLFAYEAKVARLQMEAQRVAQMILAEAVAAGLTPEEARVALLGEDAMANERLMESLRKIGFKNFSTAVTPEQNVVVLTTGSESTRSMDVVELAAQTEGRECLLFDADNALTTQQIKELLALDWRLAGVGRGDLHGRQAKDIEGNVRYLPGLNDEVTDQDRLQISQRLLERLGLMNAVSLKVDYLKAKLAADASPGSPDLYEALNRVETVYKAARRIQESRYATHLAEENSQAALERAYQLATIPLERELSNLLRQAQRTASGFAEQLDAGRTWRPQDARALLGHMRRLAYLTYLFDDVMVDASRAGDVLFDEKGTVGVRDELDRLKKNARGGRLVLPQAKAPQKLPEAQWEQLRHAPMTPGLIEKEKKRLGIEDDKRALASLQERFWRRFIAAGDLALLPALKIQPGPNGRRLEVIQDPEGNLTFVSQRFIGDAKEGKEKNPAEWVKFNGLVPLYIVDAKPQVAEGEPERPFEFFITQEFGRSFLPWKTKQWLVNEIWGKGKILTTIRAEGAAPQRRLALLMQGNPYADVGAPKEAGGSGRSGILVSTEGEEPEFVVTTDAYGREKLIEVKGGGPMFGPRTQEAISGIDRTIAGGTYYDEASGEWKVAMTTLGQLFGIVRGPQVDMLLKLSGQPAHKEDGTPAGVAAAVFHSLPWGRVDELVGQVFRSINSNWRLGYQLEGGSEDFNPRRLAYQIGAAAAELLGHFGDGNHEHIALGLDNIRDGGVRRQRRTSAAGLEETAVSYFTDEDSVVDHAQERDPFAPFDYYFPWTADFVLHRYEAVKKGELEDPDLTYFPDFFGGFLNHFLESPLVRRNLQAIERFRALQEQVHTVAQAPDPESRKAAYTRIYETFLKELRDRIIIPRAFELRLENGFDPKADSVYTSNAGKNFRRGRLTAKGPARKTATGREKPSAKQEAEEFLAAEAKVLELAERAWREDGYRPRAFDFEAARKTLAEGHQLIDQIAQREREVVTKFIQILGWEKFGYEKAYQMLVELDVAAPGLQILEEIPSYELVYELKYYPPRARFVYGKIAVEGTYGDETAYPRMGPGVLKATELWDKAEVQMQIAEAELAKTGLPRAEEETEKQAGPETFLIRGAKGDMTALVRRHPRSQTIILYHHGLAGVAVDRVAGWVREATADQASFVTFTSSRFDALAPGERLSPHVMNRLFGTKGTERAKTFLDEAEDLRRVIQGTLDHFETKGIPRGELTIVLVGRSMGGQVAPIVAADFPQIKGVLNIGGSRETFSGSGLPKERWHPLVVPPMDMQERFNKFQGAVALILAKKDLPERNASALAWVNEWAQANSDLLPPEIHHVEGEHRLEPPTEPEIKRIVSSFVRKATGAGLEEAQGPGIPLREVVNEAYLQQVETGLMVGGKVAEAEAFDVGQHDVLLVSLGGGENKRWRANRREGDAEHKITAPLFGVPLGLHALLNAQELEWAGVAILGEHNWKEVLEVFGREYEGPFRGKARLHRLAFAVQKDAGGTAHAAGHLLAFPSVRRALREDSANPLVVFTYGDNLKSRQALEDIVRTHRAEEADLTISYAKAEDPKKKGRVVQDSQSHRWHIVEQKTIDGLQPGELLAGHSKEELDGIDRVNGGLFVVSLQDLDKYLSQIRNRPPGQPEHYLTNLVDVMGEDDRKVVVKEINVLDAVNIETPQELTQFELQYRQRLGAVGLFDQRVGLEEGPLFGEKPLHDSSLAVLAHTLFRGIPPWSREESASDRYHGFYRLDVSETEFREKLAPPGRVDQYVSDPELRKAIVEVGFQILSYLRSRERTGPYVMDAVEAAFTNGIEAMSEHDSDADVRALAERFKEDYESGATPLPMRIVGVAQVLEEIYKSTPGLPEEGQTALADLIHFLATYDPTGPTKEISDRVMKSYFSKTEWARLGSVVAKLSSSAPEEHLKRVARTIAEVVQLPNVQIPIVTEEHEESEMVGGELIVLGILGELLENMRTHVPKEAQLDEPITISLLTETGDQSYPWRVEIEYRDQYKKAFDDLPVSDAVIKAGATSKDTELVRRLGYGGEGFTELIYQRIVRIPGAELRIERDDPRGWRKAHIFRDLSQEGPRVRMQDVGLATGAGTGIIIRLPVKPNQSDDRISDATRMAKDALSDLLAVPSGLEEIRLPAGATAGKVIFIGPDAATSELWAGLAQLRPASGEKIDFLVFARDASQKRQIGVGLEEWDLKPLEPVIDAHGNVGAAIAAQQMEYWSKVPPVDVHVLFNLSGLEELGQFLQVPDLVKRLERLKSSVSIRQAA